MPTLYLFDSHFECYKCQRDDSGAVTVWHADDEVPDTLASDSPNGVWCVFEGEVHDMDDLTLHQRESMGISAAEAQNCSEWWTGSMREATRDEVMAVMCGPEPTTTRDGAGEGRS